MDILYALLIVSSAACGVLALGLGVCLREPVPTEKAQCVRKRP
jgi:hypothetical protein